MNLKTLGGGTILVFTLPLSADSAVSLFREADGVRL